MEPVYRCGSFLYYQLEESTFNEVSPRTQLENMIRSTHWHLKLELIGQYGPPHKPTFVVKGYIGQEVTHGDELVWEPSYEKTSDGSSKKKAEAAVCTQLVEIIGKNPLFKKRVEPTMLGWLVDQHIPNVKNLAGVLESQMIEDQREVRTTDHPMLKRMMELVSIDPIGVDRVKKNVNRLLESYGLQLTFVKGEQGKLQVRRCHPVEEPFVLL